MKTAIGGYFELELPPARLPMHHAALKFQSARAAFLALLRATKPTRVWMPYYICDSMLAPIKAAGVDVEFYSLDAHFGIADDIELAATEILMYVNYFGVCSEQVDQVLQRFNPAQVVLDFSQAFYVEPKDCLATIYSPRKFFGLPDGGLLFTRTDIKLPEKIDEGSECRMAHLIKRLGGEPENGYVNYKNSEETLNDFEPKQMSRLTQRVMTSIDFEGAQAKRRANFDFLFGRLREVNKIKFGNIIGAPLCYPLICNDAGMKAELIRNRVFVATYWPDVSTRVDVDSLEFDLAANLLAIPCDQRYSSADLELVLSLIKS
jgi:hypothetical protein